MRLHSSLNMACNNSLTSEIRKLTPSLLAITLHSNWYDRPPLRASGVSIHECLGLGCVCVPRYIWPAIILLPLRYVNLPLPPWPTLYILTGTIGRHFERLGLASMSACTTDASAFLATYGLQILSITYSTGCHGIKNVYASLPALFTCSCHISNITENNHSWWSCS